MQFPHTGWLPDNVTLDTLDLLKPLPGHLEEKFDVVHVGLLVLVVENGDALSIFDNLLAMLSTYAPVLLSSRFRTDSHQSPVATYSGMRVILVALV